MNVKSVEGDQYDAEFYIRAISGTINGATHAGRAFVLTSHSTDEWRDESHRLPMNNIFNSAKVDEDNCDRDMGPDDTSVLRTKMSRVNWNTKCSVCKFLRII